MKKKLKEKKPRNYHALNAIQRKAGPMKDRKKEEDKNKCREEVELVWYASGGDIKKCGPFATQSEAYKAMRLQDQSLSIYPADIVVWPEEIENNE